MQKTYDFFIGIDVSKDKLDYCITNKETLQKQFGIVANNAKGINGFIKSLLKTTGSGTSAANNVNLLFCLENTGVYSMPLCYWLQAHKLNYAVVAALEIKRSKGITRGKTDKADARDIAAYALSHVQELKLSELPQDDFIELRLLLAEREKVVKAINLFATTAENKNYLPAQVLKTTLHHNKIMMAALNKQLKQIEKSIDSLIQRNDVFKHQDELLQSIPGIGRQTSIMFIAYTQRRLLCLRLTASLPALPVWHLLNTRRDPV